jgi:hypothetical protein
MPLSILVWNAQHFDHQKGQHSAAYQGKKRFLDHCLAQETVDILVLIETGKTGTPNTALINDLSGSFKPLATAVQEDGIKKDTTLGTLVLISNDKAKEFEQATGYILGGKEQRSAVVIRHIQSQYGFAFYHANSSYLAMNNAMDTITFIQSNLENMGLKKLGFFGGDLNTDGKWAHNELVTHTSGPRDPKNDYSRIVVRESPPLHKLIPSGSAYTHVSFKEQYKETAKSKEAAKRAISLAKLSGKRKTPNIIRTYKLVGYTPVVRLLDFAYVDDLSVWSSACDASFSTPAPIGDPPAKPVRISLGEEMRSDHFPVFYKYEGDFA